MKIISEKLLDKISILHFAKIVSRNDFVDSIVSNLNPEKFEVHVLTFQEASLTYSPVYKEKGITHHNLNQNNPRNFLKIVPAISKIIKQHTIQVVHAHLFEEQFIAALLKFRHPGVKFIIGRHYSDEIYLLHHGLKKKLWIALENAANLKADAIVAGSQMVQDILIRQAIPQKKIASIPYGFNFDDYRYKKNTPEQTQAIREQYGVKDEDVLFVNVGRLFRLKGQDLLIDVFEEVYKSHSNIKLLIIGDGHQRKYLEEQVKLKQLEDVIFFTGWLKDAHTYISASDTVVHPTLSEMFSQLMIESMAQGKALIINDVSGVRDVIAHYKTGIICSHNKSEWITAIQNLIDNRQLRMELGEQAELHVRQTYPIEKIIIKYETLYWELSYKK